MNMAYELVDKDLDSLVKTHILLGDESCLAATVCTLIDAYCKKTGTDIKKFSTVLYGTLMEYAEEKENDGQTE